MREALSEYSSAFGGGFAGVDGEEGTEAHGVRCAVHFVVGGREGCGRVGEGRWIGG